MTAERQTLPRLGLRIAGLVLVTSALALYDTTSAAIAHRLLLPLTLAIGAWALVQNAAAVALVVTALALIHTDLAASHWIDRLAYPAVAASGAAVLIVIASRRFRDRIRHTHDARWSGRRSS